VVTRKRRFVPKVLAVAWRLFLKFLGERNEKQENLEMGGCPAQAQTGNGNSRKVKPAWHAG
jgi:hypothetical protein